jgi:guanylate kinase
MYVIGIYGTFSSGKKSVARRLINYYGSSRCLILETNDFSTEDYALWNNPLTTNFSKFIDDLSALKTKRSLDPDAPEIVFVINSFLFYSEELVNLCDLKIYIDTPTDLCINRRLEKASSSFVRQFFHVYEKTIRPKYLEWVTEKSVLCDIKISNQSELLDVNLSQAMSVISEKTGLRNPLKSPPIMISPTFDSTSCSTGYPGRLYILAGPSGVGKGAIVDGLISRYSFLQKVIPYTSRLPRAEEIEGIHYHFITHEDFARLSLEGPMLGRFSDFGCDYGTPVKEVIQKLQSGVSLILDLHPTVIPQVGLYFPKFTSIFIAPPNMKVIPERLAHRNPGVTQNLARVIKGKKLLAQGGYENCKYFVINDQLPEAIEALSSIVLSKSLTLTSQRHAQAQLLSRFVLGEALDELETLSFLPSSEEIKLEALPSLNNDSFKVTMGTDLFFLRKPSSIPFPYRVTFEAEFETLQSVSLNKLYPTPLHFNLETGLYLAPYIANVRLLPKKEIETTPDLLESIVSAIKNIHALPLASIDYDPLKIAEETLLSLKKMGIHLPAGIDRIGVMIHRTWDLLNKTSHQKVRCNNDLSPYNLLYRESDNQVFITDWEFSGNNDPLWDLAKFSLECSFSETLDHALLSAYGLELSLLTIARLNLFKLVVEFFLAISAKWSVSMNTKPSLSTPIENIFITRLDNCEKYLHSIAFKEHVSYLNESIKRPFSYLSCEDPLPSTTVFMCSTNAALKEKPSGHEESTFMIIKPEVVATRRTASLLDYLRIHLGFSISKAQKRCLSIPEVLALYPGLSKEPVYYDALDLMTSGPVITVLLTGPLGTALKLASLKGKTDPALSPSGTLRGLFGTDKKWNAVHCSDDASAAKREIDLFFP